MDVINFTGDTWTVRVDDGDPCADALRIADAMGRLAEESRPGSTVYVGFDTRPLSRSLAGEVAEVIAAHDARTLVSAGHCPLPALAEATRRDPMAFGALMLTAGTRPEDYFGVRVRMADGSAAASADTDEIEERVVSELPARRGEAESVDIMTPYLERVSSFVDGEAVRAASPLVVCDPMGGSMAGHAARLLGSLGAHVRELHGDEDGPKGLHPEAAEPWIDDLEQAVVSVGARFGVALDGTGERIALVDEHGELVSPHLMLAMVMEGLVRGHGIEGRMVAPIFTSTVVRRQAERLGLQLTVTPAGFIWMREEMPMGDVVCAGDAMGGVSIPAIGFERDALSVAAVLLELVAQADKPVSELVSDLEAKLGAMDYGRQDVRMGAGDVQVLRNALPGINPAEVAGQRVEGVTHPAGALRVSMPGGSWVLVRPSRLSGAARVYAEAPSRASRDALLSWGRALCLSPLGEGPR